MNTSVYIHLVWDVCFDGVLPDLPEGRRGGAAAVLPQLATGKDDGDHKEMIVYCGGLDNKER